MRSCTKGSGASPGEPAHPIQVPWAPRPSPIRLCRIGVSAETRPPGLVSHCNAPSFSTWRTGSRLETTTISLLVGTSSIGAGAPATRRGESACSRFSVGGALIVATLRHRRCAAHGSRTRRSRPPRAVRAIQSPYCKSWPRMRNRQSQLPPKPPIRAEKPRFLAAAQSQTRRLPPARPRPSAPPRSEAPRGASVRFPGLSPERRRSGAG